MTISINDSVCSKYGLKEEELLTLLLIKSGVHIPTILEDLEKSKKIVKDVFGNITIIIHKTINIIETQIEELINEW